MNVQQLEASALKAFQHEMRTAPDSSPVLSVTSVRIIDGIGCESTYARCTAYVEDDDVLVVTSIDDHEYQSLHRAGTWKRATVEDGYGPIVTFTPEGE